MTLEEVRSRTELFPPNSRAGGRLGTYDYDMTAKEVS